MSHLSDATRADSAKKLREAADLLDRGEELAAGRLILAGLTPVAAELKKTYGPFVGMTVKGWLKSIGIG